MEIGLYIAERGSPATGRSFSQRLARACGSASTVASARPVFMRGGPPDHWEYRTLPAHGYKIVYYVSSDEVVVIDFWHDSRSLADLRDTLR